MLRRALISCFGGAAVSWPLAARAQQMRRVGILYDHAEGDPEGQMQIAAFREELNKLGWVEGRNITFDFRSGAVEAEQVPISAKELVTRGPDVLVGAGGTILAALQKASRTVPIVFVSVTDPVGGGLVANLARPG